MRSVSAVLLVVLLFAWISAAEPLIIANPLRLDWPAELLEINRSSADLVGINRAEGMGEPRPVQVEDAGGGRSRAWLVVTVPKIAGKPATTQQVELVGGAPLPGLTIVPWSGGSEIGNGVATIRLNGSRIYDPPLPLDQAGHWFGGLNWPSGAGGQAGFSGTDLPLVRERTAEILHSGPVMHEVRFTWRFVEDGEAGMVASPPLATGKRSHRFPPNVIPTVAVPKRNLYLAIQVRIVVGDPWIWIAEEWRLPETSRVQQTWTMGGAAGPAIEELLWTPWFEYDRFGGNNKQKTHPLSPRPEQQGRPFALLSPRWHQGGGGAQELIAVGKGAAAPAVGAVAFLPTGWLGSYPIAVDVAEGNSASWSLSHRPPPRELGWYAQRTWALIAGRREQVEGTGTINSLVRRHGDWTLQAQHESTVLEWKRDPAVVSPTILMSRQRLAQATADLASGADTAEVKLIRSWIARRDAGEKFSKEDEVLLALLTGGKPPAVGLPTPSAYLSTRYQDDFVNPTAVGNRRLFNDAFVLADLANAGKPFGDLSTAAIAYIATDLDSWPGWHHGFHPGNPNFHTDKYLAAVYAACTLADHPHAGRFAEFARSVLAADIASTLSEPDGVGYECPGYAGYALSLQLRAARALLNAGHGNIVARTPMMRATGIWHRHLLTPFDPRLGGRHEAPIGDTHRWTAGCDFRLLASFFVDSDPGFAGELEAAHRLVHGDAPPEKLLDALASWDTRIVAADPAALNWSSRTFADFGAVLRSRFGRPDESFLSFKAGSRHGHYHNDGLSLHWYGGGWPLALDYNCSYHPRGDHAGLHNTVTFGESTLVRHNGRGVNVPAGEQLWGGGEVLAKAFGPAMDVVVGERRGNSLSLAPWDPADAEFARGYPRRATGPLAHRRMVALIKHPVESALSDYLVVRDEVSGSEPALLHWHLLVRSAERIAPGLWHCPGQGQRDVLLAVSGAGSPLVSRWQYLASENLAPPGCAARPDESDQAWQIRTAGSGEAPAPVEKSQEKANVQRWNDLIASTDGRALMPPPGWKSQWKYGECQRWLRFPVAAGGATLSVLYPLPASGTVKDLPAAALPRISLSEDRVEVAIGEEREAIVLSSGSGATIERAGQRSEAIPARTLPALTAPVGP